VIIFASVDLPSIPPSERDSNCAGRSIDFTRVLYFRWRKWERQIHAGEDNHGLIFARSWEIRLDGELITNKNRDNYRQIFSVFSLTFTCSKTCWGLREATWSKATEYLQQLHLNHK